jgi:hypothetical protein
MLAVTALSANAQAIVYFFALVAFIVAAVVAGLARAHVAALTAAGLALFTFVPFWNALAASWVTAFFQQGVTIVPIFWKDLLERIFWTAAEAGVGVAIVVNTDTPTAYAAVIASALALVKGFIAKQLGNKDSASTVPSVWPLAQFKGRLAPPRWVAEPGEIRWRARAPKRPDIWRTDELPPEGDLLVDDAGNFIVTDAGDFLEVV